MKKLIAFPALFVLLTSCAGTYRQARYVSGHAYTGMSLEEFKRIAKRRATLESLESGYTVYRINDYDVMYGGIIDTKFYYFDHDGKLAKIDGGQYKSSRQEIDVTNH